MTASSSDAMRGVVFDMDGVLVDSEHLWEESWVDFCRRHGRTWTPEDTAHVQGMSAPEWAGYIARLCGDPNLAATVNDECVGYVIRALERGEVELLDGATAMVTTAAGRVPVAIASSAPRTVIDAVLHANGLTASFTATVSSEEVPRGKPSPDVYSAAAARLGVPPESCVGVEDSGNGIRAARAAGLTVVAIPNPTYPPKPDALALTARVAGSHADARDWIAAALDGRPTPVGGGSAQEVTP